MTTVRTATRGMNRAPLAGKYPVSVGLALLGLCPFIVLTTAFTLTEKSVVTDLHTTMVMGTLSGGLSNAAYAFGAVTAADLILRLPQRWLFVGCEAVFVAGSLLCVFASGIGVFTFGRVLEGLTTGILLVVGLPPLVTKFGSDKLPLSALFINLGLFGMVTLGPVVGGLAGGFHGWRLLFAAIAALGVIGLLLGLVGYGHQAAPTPAIGFDLTAVPLAFGGTFLPFFASSWLEQSGYVSFAFLAPLLIGLAMLLALVWFQYRRTRALMPVGPVSHTLPVVGIGAAMVGGAAFVVLLELSSNFLLMVVDVPPAVVGGLLAPLLLGLAAGAVLFKVMLPTRWLAALILGGLGVEALAAVVLLGLTAGDATVMVPIVAVLLGFGAGATVAPGLFLAALAVPTSKIGPTFALVELLRSEAAFILAPILSYVAMTSVGSLSGGTQLATGVTFGLLAVTSPMLVGLLLLGGVGPHAPKLDTWLAGDGLAYDSLRVGAAVRGR